MVKQSDVLNKINLAIHAVVSVVKQNAVKLIELGSVIARKQILLDPVYIQTDKFLILCIWHWIKRSNLQNNKYIN